MSTDKFNYDLLHRALAETLLSRCQDGSATASDLNVARQFLKDNAVDSVAPSDEILRLLDSLPERMDAEDPITQTG